ncbi:hypothetical protein, partial [Serratia plymuthica]|uniref:hypothetical protein n=1 Tax=Serratia plymuthica TaxID=82996 RepID=UPI001BAEA1FB
AAEVSHGRGGAGRALNMTTPGPANLPGFLLPKNRPTSQNTKIKNQRRCLRSRINYMLIFSFLNVTRS